MSCGLKFRDKISTVISGRPQVGRARRRPRNGVVFRTFAGYFFSIAEAL